MSTENVRFEFDGLKFEVTSARIPAPNGRKLGYAFNFSLAVFSPASGAPIFHLNSLALLQDRDNPGKFRIISPRKTWGGGNTGRREGSIASVYFYAGQDNPKQITRQAEFVKMLIPYLKQQIPITQQRLDDRKGVDEEFYDG